MKEIMTTRHLLAQGYSHQEMARLRRQGSLDRVRRGAYAAPSETALSSEQQHRRLVEATIQQLVTDVVVSHTSAAVVHGLPVWAATLAIVHVTRNRNHGGRKRHLLAVHAAPLRPGKITLVDGLAVTSLSRTVLDLARTLPFEQAVAAGDRALRIGLTRNDLQSALLTLHRWPGIGQARRVAAFLDGRSETAGESVSRVRMHEDLVPAPVPQTEIVDGQGRVVARVDFGWEEQRTVGEFDGKVKYGRLLKPGQSSENVVFDEKCREDAVRDLGWQFVRWIWADLYRPYAIRDRLLRAFERSRP